MKGIPIDISEDSVFYNHLNNNEVLDVYINYKNDFVTTFIPGTGVSGATSTPADTVGGLGHVSIKAISFEYWLKSGANLESKVFKNSALDMSDIKSVNFDYSKIRKNGFEPLDLTNRAGTFDNTDFVYISGHELKRLIDSEASSILVFSPMIAVIGESLDRTTNTEYFNLKIEALPLIVPFQPTVPIPPSGDIGFIRRIYNNFFNNQPISSSSVGNSSMKQGMAFGAPCPPRWRPG